LISKALSNYTIACLTIVGSACDDKGKFANGFSIIARGYDTDNGYVPPREIALSNNELRELKKFLDEHLEFDEKGALRLK
jgi:hypothetical protein